MNEAFQGTMSGPGGGFRFAPPTPGAIMPKVFQDVMNVTEAQKKQIAELQKDVDAKLEALLTTDQKTQIKAILVGTVPSRGSRYSLFIFQSLWKPTAPDSRSALTRTSRVAIAALNSARGSGNGGTR